MIINIIEKTKLKRTQDGKLVKNGDKVWCIHCGDDRCCDSGAPKPVFSEVVIGQSYPWSELTVDVEFCYSSEQTARGVINGEVPVSEKEGDFLDRIFGCSTARQ